MEEKDSLYFCKNISLLVCELKEKLTVVGNELTDEEKDFLIFDSSDFSTILRTMSNTDLENLINDLYKKRFVAFQKHLVNKFPPIQIFRKNCLNFYYLNIVILCLEVFKDNIKNNVKHNDVISISVGFALGTMSKIDTISNITFSKLYDIYDEYMKERK